MTPTTIFRARVLALGLVLVSAVPFARAQGVAPLSDYNLRVNTEQSMQIQALEQRLARVEATHPEALVEALRSQGEAIKTQQTLLWGVLGAVLINILTATPRFTKRRPEGE